MTMMNTTELLKEFSRILTFGAMASLAAPLCATPETVYPPKPYGAVPSARQLAWHERGPIAFVHFSINTFTDREWGLGDESPALFAPSDFDAVQIAHTAKAAGLRAIVLTAKHHDGFCLWPSRYTDHSIAHSPYRDGRGDIVGEMAKACRDEGLGFGIYLSPWDRNRADYGQPSYLTYYRNQLRELLTNYGPLCEVWFDGANGGDGYYGGAREMRKIDKTSYYDWPTTWALVRALQPGAVIFSDGGPDVRWVGNEKGFAGEPCWATINAAGFLPGVADVPRLPRGDYNGAQWMPAEVDVSIRPGWFHHPAEDAQVKSVADLTKIYLESIGRGAGLILNLTPDRRGRIPPGDGRVLAEWGDRLRQAFSRDLAAEAAITASATRGQAPAFAARNLITPQRDRYWATDDDVHTASIELTFPRPTRLDLIRLREYLPLGQRIARFAVEAWTGAAWKELAAGESIGAQRLLQVPALETTKLRIRLVSPDAAVVLRDVAVYRWE